MWLLRNISLAYLARQPGRVLLAVVGVAAGVASLVATGGVCDSVFQSFRDTTRAAVGDAPLHVTASGLGLPATLADQVRDIRGVLDVGPVVEGFVTRPGGDQIAVFGIDILSDPRSRDAVRNGTIGLTDEIDFLTHADSAVLPHSLAGSLGLDLGASLEVLGPSGVRRLTVRGLMPDGGIASLFGGRVAIMDVAAAQAVLELPDRLDRIDVWPQPGQDADALAARLRGLVGGIGAVETTDVLQQRVEHLLFAIRVFLTMAAFVAVVVGFFIVYHTVAALVHHRRRHVAIVNALGVSRRAIYGWLLLEATLLAGVGIFFGYVAGVAIGDLSLRTFGDITASWVQQAGAPALAIGASTRGLAIGLGLVTTWAATALAAFSFLRQPTARLLGRGDSQDARPALVRSATRLALLGGCIALALVVMAPATLPFAPLLAYILLIEGILLFSFGLLGPAAARVLGGVLTSIAARRSGVVLLLAGSNTARNPGSFIIAVTAIVMGVAATLTSYSLTTSLEASALAWLRDHYRSDLVVSAKGSFLRILTAPTIGQDVVDSLAHTDGVGEVQAVRTTHVDYAGWPAALLAFDRSSHGFTVYDAEWSEIAETFWSGEGVLVSDNLARMREIRRGAELRLASPTGEQTFAILGTFPDYAGGTQHGSFAISRPAYRQRWSDDLVNRVRIWVTSGSSVDRVQASINAEFADSHGLHALAMADVRDEISGLIRGAFSLMHALVAVALLVSFVGVVNFLLTGVSDRRQEVDTLRATGLSQPQTIATTVAEGGAIGLVGTALGVVAGFVSSLVIVYHSVPMVTGWVFMFRFPVAPVAVVGVGAVLLAALAGIPSGLVAARSATSVDAWKE